MYVSLSYVQGSSMRPHLVEPIRDPGIGVGIQLGTRRTSAPPDVHKNLTGPVGTFQREPQRQHRVLGICVLTSDPWCLHVLYGFSRDRYYTWISWGETSTHNERTRPSMYLGPNPTVYRKPRTTTDAPNQIWNYEYIYLRPRRLPWTGIG